MKKIICLLMVLLLSGCNLIDNKEPEEVESKYIEPINEVNILNELNDELGERFKKVLNDSDLEEDIKNNNNLISMIGTKLEDLVCKDYYDNEVHFSDYQDKKLIFEIVQNTCEHCKKQVSLTEEIIKDTDAIFVQYFAFGNKEEIDQFYKDAGSAIPDTVTIIPHDDMISKYFIGIGVDQTPTFLFFNNGVLTLARIAELSKDEYVDAYEFAYTNPIKKEDLINNEGISVFELERTYDDVLNDLSTSSKDKLALIENSEQLTIENIGKYVEFYTMYEEEEDAIYKLETFTDYINKPLIVFYLGNINNNIENDVMMVNEFVDNHPDLSALTIFIDNKDLSTSKAYQEIDLELKSDYVSSKAGIPTILLDTEVYEYPACIFIQDNVITGGFNKIKDIESIETAYSIFIGKESIAIKKNNEIDSE